MHGNKKGPVNGPHKTPQSQRRLMELFEDFNHKRLFFLFLKKNFSF